MAPPTKKQKTMGEDGSSLKPIVFYCAGQTPDTRLMVFDQEYHCHSMLLKMNSAFFRKFLDSLDKSTVDNSSASTQSGTTQAGMVPMSLFQYDWVTKVDEDERCKWSLVANDPKPYNLESFTGEEGPEKATFNKLLCAIHFESYTIDSSARLRDLTDYADYYAALPILSKTLDGALIKSPSFCVSIWEDANNLFCMASRLRNALLFRESLVYVTIPFFNPRFEDLKDRKLHKIAKNAYNEIASKVTKATSAALLLGARDFGTEGYWGNRYDIDLFQDLYCNSSVVDHPDGAMSYPRWFRTMLKSNIGSNTVLQHPLAELMAPASSLVLDKGAYVSGEGDWSGDFLCATIVDEDLPWDIDEKDW